MECWNQAARSFLVNSLGSLKSWNRKSVMDGNGLSMHNQLHYYNTLQKEHINDQGKEWMLHAKSECQAHFRKAANARKPYPHDLPLLLQHLKSSQLLHVVLSSPIIQHLFGAVDQVA